MYIASFIAILCLSAPFLWLATMRNRKLRNVQALIDEISSRRHALHISEFECELWHRSYATSDEELLQKIGGLHGLRQMGTDSKHILSICMNYHFDDIDRVEVLDLKRRALLVRVAYYAAKVEDLLRDNFPMVPMSWVRTGVREYLTVFAIFSNLAEVYECPEVPNRRLNLQRP